METVKQNIRQLTREELAEYFRKLGEKPFRAGQVWDWLWVHHVGGFDQMTNLSGALRQKLAGDFLFPVIRIDHMQTSTDGTIKSRFVLHDGHQVEGVLIPTEKRQTACVSSQAGCSLSCRFCATGFLERKRNLDFEEIYDEVSLINKQSLESTGKRLTNIVYMGMGEPLLNYAHVLKSIERITAPDGMAMSPRRITVSTAGISKMIKKLGDDKVRFNLALSLHAPNDKKRSEVMPINEKNDLKSLSEALNYFYLATKNDITFEYILFKDFNDSLKDADELIRLYRQMPVKVINLIEYNPIEQARFSKPAPEKVEAFMNYLSRHRVNARLRRSRGKDIDAACGQLANKG
ncbi:MAG TPA: 23S rRNA (adenine(2503)-C(2))-methyltransferase RlmN [Chitinophagaceae bacterium]|jgi:23S rRNA (adenine2503-C2)-methyltransferase|nr:23S rRNA (adenine(2503)-C(2))-methyltransferase RlmN [Chitinophagaceae bacterium]